jgi:hypothetical protein
LVFTVHRNQQQGKNHSWFIRFHGCWALNFFINRPRFLLLNLSNNLRLRVSFFINTCCVYLNIQTSNLCNTSLGNKKTWKKAVASETSNVYSVLRQWKKSFNLLVICCSLHHCL